MANEKIVDIIIEPDGTTTVETSGFEGKSCEDVTRQTVQALGTVESVQHKAEYHQRGRVATRTAGGGR